MGEPEPLLLPLSEELGDTVGELEPRRVGVTEGDTEGEGVSECVAQGLGEAQGEGERDGDGVGVTPPLGDTTKVGEVVTLEVA